MTKKTWFAPTREEILECLRSAGAPMTPAELVGRLEVPSDQVEALNKRLSAMERDGQLLPDRKGLLRLASALDLIAGRVQGHRDGFGFLIPDAGGPDVFLAPRQMQKAMHGDRVLVRQTGFDSRGRPEGRIVEVTERADRRIVGRFLNERGASIVVPEDQRIKHDIVIPPGDTHRARHGQVVTVEIVDPPADGAPPIGRVLEVLGEIDDPGMEIEIAVRKFDVPHEFSNAALERAAALPGAVRPADMRGRVDLRDVPLVTIDGEDARDFDDAVYCEPIEVSPGGESVGDAGAGAGDEAAAPDETGAAPAPGGRRAAGSRKPDASGFRLLVAIADVSHYVRTGEPLDVDAAQRGTSVYFPRRVIPMLPERLSNGLCSLNPQVDRLVLVCDMVIDATGRIRAYQFYEAVMRSAARLTYDEVWSMLSGGPAHGVSQEKLALRPGLRNLHELYLALAGARRRRGAIEIESVETRIVCDPAGRIERIVPSSRNDAHRLIEECMLAANVCTADFMRRSRHPGLFRVHEGPGVEKLRALREFLRSVGLSLGGGDSPSPRDYAVLAEQIRPRPDHQLLQTMMLRSMQQAVYAPENIGHFGLAYDAYTHFTSPIRRYPDLMTHRVIKALLRGARYRPPELDGHAAREGRADFRRDARRAAKAPAGDRAASRELAADLQETVDLWHRWGMRCSAFERRADEASRDVEAWLKCMYMRERVGEQYTGRITGVAPFGVFVTLDELYVEGMVHVSELGSDYFQYSDSGHELRGERTGRRFRLTDPIDVQVSRVDLEARRIEFRLVQPTGLRSPGRERLRTGHEGVRVRDAAGRGAAKDEGGEVLTGEFPELPLPPHPKAAGNRKRTDGAKTGTVAPASPGKTVGKTGGKPGSGQPRKSAARGTATARKADGNSGTKTGKGAAKRRHRD